MVTTQFGAILKDLEPLFNCKLEPDANNVCLIKLKSGIKVQVELDRHGDLLIGVRLGTIPSSRYLENILKEALKANQLQFPLASGVLGYSTKTNQLILFMTVDNRSITSERLTTTLGPFLTKAKLWSEAIQHGEIPLIEAEKQSPRGIFGLT